jgi:hypothetical protein
MAQAGQFEQMQIEKEAGAAWPASIIYIERATNI